jgi:hypothetical protein
MTDQQINLIVHVVDEATGALASITSGIMTARTQWEKSFQLMMVNMSGTFLNAKNELIKRAKLDLPTIIGIDGKDVEDYTGVITDAAMRWGDTADYFSERLIEQGKTVGQVAAGPIKEMTERTGTFKSILFGTGTALGRFRFEMLGVMFYGMQIAQTFNNMLQPAFTAMGIFEEWTDTLEIIFLPAAEDVSDVMDKINDALQNLPEPVQKVIGWIGLLTASFGTLMFQIGTTVLGIYSVAMALGIPVTGLNVLGVAAQVFTVVVAGLSSALSFVAGLLSGPVIVGIILLAGAWMANGEKISQAAGELFASISLNLESIIGVVTGLVDFLSAIFAGDATKAFEALKDVGKHTVDFLINAFWNFLVALGKIFWEVEYGIGKFVVGLITGVVDLGAKIIYALGSGVLKAAGWFMDIFWSIIPEPFRGMLKGLGGAVGGAIAGVGGWMHSVTGFQGGGIVASPTLAMIGEHGPEAVIPLSQIANTFNSPTIIVNASISSDIDIRTLAEKISGYLDSGYRRSGF